MCHCHCHFLSRLTGALHDISVLFFELISNYFCIFRAFFGNLFVEHCTRDRRLFTEVLAPDGMGLFTGGRKTSVSSAAALTRMRGALLRGSRSLQTTSSKRVLLEKGTADECEQTVGGRMDAVTAALEPCSLRQNAGKL